MEYQELYIYSTGVHLTLPCWGYLRFKNFNSDKITVKGLPAIKTLKLYKAQSN